jgi:hypothetical protein
MWSFIIHYLNKVVWERIAEKTGHWKIGYRRMRKVT